MNSSHMNKLLQVEKVTSSKNCKDIRQLYDQVESHVRSLKTVGVNSEHYGPLLIPVILERVPNDIKLEISRKLGTANWKIDDFMQILKDEITARESCDFLQSQTREAKSEREADRHISTEALFAGAKVLVCAFCSQNHFHDKCHVVTEMKQRKDIVWKKRLCYRCLFAGHAVRKCKRKHGCFKCRSPHHHTAICETELRRNADPPLPSHEEKDVSGINLVNSRTSVLLQTANAVVSDNAEKRCFPIKILFDSGSQKTYVSQRIVIVWNYHRPILKR